MGQVIFIRHGISEWNKLGIWTGWENPGLAPDGVQGAVSAGQWANAQGLTPTVIYESDLTRAVNTTDGFLKGFGRDNFPRTKAMELRERDYGGLTGLNKWEVKEKVGEEQFTKYRRSPFERPPVGEKFKGESLADCRDRSFGYFQKNILPRAMKGENVVVSAHGNSIRAILWAWEKIGDEDIPNLEVPWTVPLVYEVDPAGKILKSYAVTADGPKSEGATWRTVKFPKQ